jgi:hypothetical protein
MCARPQRSGRCYRDAAASEAWWEPGASAHTHTDADSSGKHVRAQAVRRIMACPGGPSASLAAVLGCSLCSPGAAPAAPRPCCSCPARTSACRLHLPLKRTCPLLRRAYHQLPGFLAQRARRARPRGAEVVQRVLVGRDPVLGPYVAARHAVQHGRQRQRGALPADRRCQHQAQGIEAGEQAACAGCTAATRNRFLPQAGCGGGG